MTVQTRSVECRCAAGEHPIAVEQLTASDQSIGNQPHIAAACHKQIERLILARRLRATMFGSGLFADPAWDVLLALYAANLANGRVNAAELCSAADLPLSTVERWINALDERGLIQISAPPPFGSVKLSPSARSVMSRYFSAISMVALPLLQPRPDRTSRHIRKDSNEPF